MHLRYDMMKAGLGCNENRHPQEVMRELGITYQHATPQSICEQWWFWNCEGVSESLPEYLTELQLDPLKMVGYGLSEKKAQEISDFSRKLEQP